MNKPLKHDGDCFWWNAHVCTCGLLHYWMPRVADSDCPREVQEQLGTHGANLDVLSRVSSARMHFDERWTAEQGWRCDACCEKAEAVRAEMEDLLKKIFGES